MPSFLRHALVGTSAPDTAVLAGLRTLCCALVVVGHTFLLSTVMLNASQQSSLLPPPGAFAVLIAMSYAGIDIFLFVSGYLLVDGLLHRFPLSPPPMTASFLARYALARWSRLAPLYLLTAALWRVFGGVDQCISVSEALFVRNLFVTYSSLATQRYCLGHGWFVPVDLHAHLLLLAALTAARSWRTAGRRLVLLTTLLCALRVAVWLASGRPVSTAVSLADVIDDPSFVVHVARTLGMHNGGTPPIPANRESFIRAQRLYLAPVHRAMPTLVGGAAAIARHTQSPTFRAVRAAPLASIGLAAALLAAFVRGFRAAYDDASLPLWYVVYEACGRTAVAVSTALLVLSTVPGPDLSSIGMVLRTLLSNRVLVGLSRYCYAVYLNHVNFVPMVSLIWPVLNQNNYSYWRVFVNGLKVYVVAVAGCSPFCLFEEVCHVWRRRVLSLSKRENKVKVG